MPESNPAEKAARILSKQLLALEDIVRETTETVNTTLGFEQLRRWKDMTVKFAVATISARLSDKSPEVRAAARVAYRKITGVNA